MPTHQGQAFTQRAPIPAKPACEKPWRAHHTKAPCRSYFGSRSRTRGSGQRGGEGERIDFREATEAIRQVIAFARSLPHVTNNRRNVERRIRQHETQRTESGTSTTSSSQGHSPIPQPPKPQPPPGVGAYRPPMLRDPPPHLDSDVAPEDSAMFTVSAHGVDSHCKAAKPSRDVSCADSPTQPAVGPDLDLSQENSKKSEKIPENSEKNSGNSQSTSYGDILDPTLHAIALAPPPLSC